MALCIDKSLASSVFLTLLLFYAGCSATSYAASEVVFNFDIPSTDASSAIRALSRQTGNPTIFQSNDVEDIDIQALKGSYTLEQALKILLEDTVLSGDITENGVITISRSDSSDADLDPIEEETAVSVTTNLVAALFNFFRNDGPSQAPAQSREQRTPQLEEIVVTGRNRKEALLDIPVSISVLSTALLAEENVLSLNDLTELVPGLYYNQGENEFDDRLAALPSIRGISSSEIATNRTKISSFVDGLPILGSVGAINIASASQVEVYSGPQSAAFGRSTFAGAINYLTANPTDEISGSANLNWSDQGTRIVSGNISGPISDTLGFHLGANYEDSESPDGDLYSYSDGIETNTRGGQNISARFVWAPTDRFSTRLSFTQDTTEDGPASNGFFATQASSSACFNALNTFEYAGRQGARVGVQDIFDCELEINRDAELIAVHDIARYYAENSAAFDAQVQAAIDAGATDGEFGDYSVADSIRLIAEAYSVPHEGVGTRTERDRGYAQFVYDFDSGSELQLSVMQSEDKSSRAFTRYSSSAPYDITYLPAESTTSASYRYGLAMGTQFSETSINEIDESYVEIRWASPDEERLRYLFGAAYYNYEFLSEVNRGGNYNAVTQGTVADIFALTGNTVAPNTTFSEFTENFSGFFNASYDFTDKVTGSIEGRYAADKVGGRLPSEPNTAPQFVTSKSFTPRIALSYARNENTSYYLQYAVGVNPGGINATLLNNELRELIDLGIPIPVAPNSPIDLDMPNTFTRDVSVNYNSAEYTAFDEERLTNYEFGFKGSALEDRLSFTGAIYHMIWEDAVQPINLDWDYAYADNDLIGQPVAGIANTFYVAETPDTDARVFANSGTSKTTGIELQANYWIHEKWSLKGNASLMRAEHSDFCSSALFTANPGYLGTLAELEVGEDEVGDDCFILDGKKLTRQPVATLSITPSYQIDISNGLRFSASARFQYTGKTYMDAANLARTPPIMRVNLTFSLSSDTWSGTFYLENLLDDKTISAATPIRAERYDSLYVDSGISGAAEQDLFFRADGASTTDFSHLSYQIPIGRTIGFRGTYRF